VSLGLRLAITAAGAVAIAILVASGVMYYAVQRALIQETDAVLTDRAAQVRPLGRGVIGLPPPARDIPGAKFDVLMRIVDGEGRTHWGGEGTADLPVDTATREIAAGRAGQNFTEMTFAGERYRILTVPLVRDFALQVARPLAEVDAVLQRLTLILGAVLVVGVVLAAAVGGLVARSGLAPLGRLTRTLEELTRTRDLTRRVEAGGSDELGRLAGSFNSLLAALDTSLRSQRQLVADASHELRTPITSVRTNLELLQRGMLEPGERDRVLVDVVTELGRLSHLVAELIDLAREEEGAPAPVVDVRLDEIAQAAVAVAAQEWPGVEFTLVAEPSFVKGDPDRIERAIRNLLDNAAKWSPPGGVIEVVAQAGEVAVRDHGPGVSEADAPHVFDRFWRAPTARRMPGSGLGLSIVREVARSHGGTVGVERAPGGGALFRIRFPATAGGSAT
jgi:two-component system sensor histidine kinase MprB